MEATIINRFFPTLGDYNLAIFFHKRPIIQGPFLQFCGPHAHFGDFSI